ncbi:unnamed protein product [Onchocerca flexuosa]|uniref:Uncharacterized protein n=1 Tax=Onchocerca flexuosa TaxID=387005 RepID=A0A183HRI5_9BILA|nr:unnamed protein product [Onchocerca flexuosa]
MCSSAKELLRSKWALKVLRIYLNDFKDIIFDGGLIIYQFGKTLIQSSITKIIQLPKNVVESSINEFQHLFDTGPVPKDFDYSILMINHFWDYIIINAKCYGEDFASTFMGHVIFSRMAKSNVLSFIFLHILLPKLAFLLHRKISMVNCHIKLKLNFNFKLNLATNLVQIWILTILGQN